ncbi:MAG: hypothetical protein KDA57_16635, partial [Planctomycetales bacterium]|nr:hypothetical protein [Planctomycetales bacterium]
MAWCTSLGIHLLLLTVLAAASLVIDQGRQESSLSYEPPELIEEEETLPQEFLASETPMEEYGALSQAGDDSARAAAMVIEDQSLVVFEPETITDFGQRLSI